MNKTLILGVSTAIILTSLSSCSNIELGETAAYGAKPPMDKKTIEELSEYITDKNNIDYDKLAIQLLYEKYNEEFEVYDSFEDENYKGKRVIKLHPIMNKDLEVEMQIYTIDNNLIEFTDDYELVKAIQNI